MAAVCCLDASRLQVCDLVGFGRADTDLLARTVYNVGWLQANLTSSTGPDNTVGSIRVISSGSLVGTYDYIEKVISSLCAL